MDHQRGLVRLRQRWQTRYLSVSSFMAPIPSALRLGLDAARAFGIAYRLDDATFAKMKSFGVDLEAARPEPASAAGPLSVYRRSNRHCAFPFFNPDFRVRLDAASVLAAAQMPRNRFSGSGRPTWILL